MSFCRIAVWVWKVIVRGHRQNERIGSRFRGDGTQRIRLGGCVIVQRVTNDPVFGLGIAMVEQNLAWTGHFAGLQSLAYTNMDSPEAQPYYV
jgi:hypothetical protein